jgi:2-phosphosulfolactate phosphatase
MVRKCDLAFTPEELDRCEAVNEKVVVVIDVLRTTTAIVQAIHAKCETIIPVLTPDEARDIAKELPPEHTILAGTRKGKKLEGFQLSSSPLDYNEERVRDKTVVLTTTNGTRTLRKAAVGKAVLIGAFLNATAVADVCYGRTEDILLVCSGLLGRFALEDVICAGLILKTLGQRPGPEASLVKSDSALAAEVLYERFGSDLLSMLRLSAWGCRLQDQGADDDLIFSVQVDVASVVPVLEENRIIRLP